MQPEQVLWLSKAFDIYGIRSMHVDEAQHLLTIEYDATRMDANRVAAIVRGCGIEAEFAPPPSALAQT